MDLHQVLIFLASFAASAVEVVEAVTIVLAVGVTRGWRSTWIGVGVAALALAVLVVVFGPALLTLVPHCRAAGDRRHAAADLRPAMAAQGDHALYRA